MRSWPWHSLSLFVLAIAFLYLGFTTSFDAVNADPDRAMTRHAALINQGFCLMFVGTFGVAVASASVASWRRFRELEKRVLELERRQGIPTDAAGSTQR